MFINATKVELIRDKLIQETYARIDAGEFDSSEGMRPYRAFVDRDGDISVEYAPLNGKNYTVKISY